MLMTKMVTDWFAGREIATAISILITSWPIGIAAALSILPFIAAFGGLVSAFGLTVGLAAAGALALLTRYRDAEGGVAAGGVFPSRRVLAPVAAAASAMVRPVK